MSDKFYRGQDYVHAHNKNIRNADYAAAVRRAFDLIADANTVTILTLGEMQNVVLRELGLQGEPTRGSIEWLRRLHEQPAAAQASSEVRAKMMASFDKVIPSVETRVQIVNCILRALKS